MQNSVFPLGKTVWQFLKKLNTELTGTSLAVQRLRLSAPNAGAGKQCQTLFFGAPKSLQMIAAMKLKDAYPWKKSYDQPR